MSLVRFIRRQPLGFRPFPVSPAFEDVENRMRRIFENTLSAPFDKDLSPEVLGWMPPMEIIETATELTVTVEVPGLDKKDLDISVDDGILTVRGEKSEAQPDGKEEKRFHLFERTYGAFQRSFTLPRSVDASKTVAEFDKGILTIRLPKAVELKPKGQKVEIVTK